MKFKQGMGRLAIFAGALGMIAGGFYAYKDLRNVPSERYQHRVFENLAGSDVVKQAQAGLPLLKGVPPGLTAVPLPSSEAPDPPRSLPANFNSWDSSVTKELDGSFTAHVSDSRIRTIFFKPDFSIDFFAMTDGGIVSSGPSPSAWLYMLWLVFPVVGFLIIWSAIYAVGWVISGFFPALS